MAECRQAASTNRALSPELWSCGGSNAMQASPRPCGVVPSPLAPRDILRSLLPNPYAVSCFPLPVASVVASSVIRVHERPGSQVAGCVSAAERERCALLRSTVPLWHQPCAGRFPTLLAFLPRARRHGWRDTRTCCNPPVFMRLQWEL
jgi:hypothetical protein